MKRILIAFLFAAPAFAGTPEHFFDSLELHPNAPQTAAVPTIPPPPVMTPIDPTPIISIVGQALGQSSAWTQWSQDNLLKVGAKLDSLTLDVANTKTQITSLQDQVAKIPVGPAGPTGPQGISGNPGVSPTIQAGTVTFVPCSTPASVTNTGTSTAAIFNFSIPQCGGAPPLPTTTTYTLSVSTSAVRVGAVNLSGLAVKGTVYIFTSAALNDPNPSGIAGVCYWLDAPVTAAPVTCEGGVPFDFAGSASATTANPWNSATIPNGVHTITQRVVPIVGNPEIDTVSFTIVN